jgi:hypothetical protein
MKSSHTGNGTE